MFQTSSGRETDGPLLPLTPPMSWYEIAVGAADAAFIIAAVCCGFGLVALLVWQNLLG